MGEDIKWLCFKCLDTEKRHWWDTHFMSHGNNEQIDNFMFLIFQKIFHVSWEKWWKMNTLFLVHVLLIWFIDHHVGCKDHNIRIHQINDFTKNIDVKQLTINSIFFCEKLLQTDTNFFRWIEKRKKWTKEKGVKWTILILWKNVSTTLKIPRENIKNKLMIFF